MNAPGREPAAERELATGDIMTPRVLAVGPDMPLVDALRVMVTASMRHLPVLDEGICVGLLTESCALAVLAERGPLMDGHGHGLVARDACHGRAPSVPVGAAVSDVAKELLAGRHDAVLVRDRGKVVGIITTTDLIRVIAS